MAPANHSALFLVSWESHFRFSRFAILPVGLAFKQTAAQAKPRGNLAGTMHMARIGRDTDMTELTAQINKQ